MPGLYLPKSHRELREQKQAQIEMDKFARARPDFDDSRLLEGRLRVRDDAMRVVWAHQGPHMNRWVVIRTDADGMPHVVSVIRHEDGSYKRPDPALAETFVDTWGSVGNQILKEMEAREAAKAKEAADIEAANDYEVAERIAHAITKHQGVHDRVSLSGSRK